MPKKKKFHISNDALRLILVLVGTAFSIAVLTLATLALVKIQSGDVVGSSMYLFFIFLLLGLSRLVTFFVNRTKISFLRFVILFVFDVVLGILIFFGKDNPYLYSLCCGLFCVTTIVSRCFKIIENHTTRNLVFNLVVIVFFALLGIGLFIPVPDELVFAPITIVCFLIAFTSLIEVLSGAIAKLKLKTLFKIIIRTYALEIILGLLTLMVASALVFMFYEDTIPTFGDGLWYAFAVVTTIGFGDFAATTFAGRIVTVLLGIYGIFVVAVITSIIVNFYNETSGKNDAKEFKDIHKEDK